MKNKSIIGISIISIGIGVALGYVWGRGNVVCVSDSKNLSGYSMMNMDEMHLIQDGTMIRNDRLPI